MEFGILFTSHPNIDVEPYPHHEAHARVTQEILRADMLGYDYAWVAEHHFSNEYGIMPDVFVYAAYLAALTQRIKIGTAVVTLPLANPLRVAENAAFVDILSQGRFALGLGSGYRRYEFDGFGVDFDRRRDIQEEALPLLMELFHNKRVDHHGDYFSFKVGGTYELFPHPLQQPHPPIFLAGATERSIGTAARMGFGLFLSTWTPFDELGRQAAHYRASLKETPEALRANPGRGHIDVARWVYVAETDAKAKRDSEAGLMRHLAHFASGHTSGYLGTVSQDVGASPRDYDALTRDIILHGSPASVIEKIEELREKTQAASIMLHYPPWYGIEKALASLELFAAEVMPKFKQTTRGSEARQGARAVSARP
ncbi:MAG TPA: LLM class flavin-dependent oxidoreductase [Xanthobacteraceae bacterium]|jgi:alkanesulfonate monooxygenase SsuD/methylene tetrahydromethanopterin reductase-like flavin-dependent oxidoreductase (luciferase family)